MAHQPLGGRPVAVVRGNPDVPPPTEDQKVSYSRVSCTNRPRKSLFILFLENAGGCLASLTDELLIKIIDAAADCGLSPAQVGCFLLYSSAHQPYIPFKQLTNV